MVKATCKPPLLLSFVVAAIMAVGVLLWVGPQAQSQESARECETVPIVGDASDCLEKTVSSDSVIVGERITFTVTETSNFFVGSALDLRDELPPSVRIVSFSGGPFLLPGECRANDHTITCPGEEIRLFPFTLTIEVIPTQCGTFTNTAFVQPVPDFETPTVELPFTVVGCEEEAPASAPAPAPAPITQETEQESESGEIDQTFEIS